MVRELVSAAVRFWVGNPTQARGAPFLHVYRGALTFTSRPAQDTLALGYSATAFASVVNFVHLKDCLPSCAWEDRASGLLTLPFGGRRGLRIWVLMRGTSPGVFPNPVFGYRL